MSWRWEHFVDCPTLQGLCRDFALVDQTLLNLDIQKGKFEDVFVLIAKILLWWKDALPDCQLSRESIMEIVV